MIALGLLALCCCASVCAAGTSRRSPQMLVSRPLKVSDKTQPIMSLILDNGDIANQPRQKDLNRNKLSRRLESEFDPRWMSIDPPASGDASERDSNPVNPETPARLLNELRSLNLTHSLNHVAAFPEARSALEFWLIERATCPVRYEWVNIGPLFWPPWVKHGTCVPRQCSWPSGMKCVPGETNIITLLRWHCMSASPEEDRSSRKRNKCRWLKVPYPLISECVCTCG